MKRVILTSSVAAISNGTAGDPSKPADYLYTETDWSTESLCQPYEKSKLKAERAAWDYMKELDEDKKFELVVVNPGYVQGPLLSPVGGDGTKALPVSLLNASLPALPDLWFPMVDVRDVAAAQIAAMEKPEAAGNRYALVSSTSGMREIGRIVAEEFKPQGYKVPSGSLPKPLLWLVSLFDKQAKGIYPFVGKAVRFKNDKMVAELGITPTPLKDTMIDTCYSLIELGVIRKTPRYLGHPSTRPKPPPAAEPAASDKDAEQPAEKEPEPAAEESASKEPEKPVSQPEESASKEPEKPVSQPEEPASKEPESTEPEQPAEEEPASKEPEESSEPTEPEPAASQPEEAASKEETSEEAGKEGE